MIQFQVNYQIKELYIIAIILKYKKSFLIILLLYILLVVKYCGSYYPELYEINKK